MSKQHLDAFTIAARPRYSFGVGKGSGALRALSSMRREILRSGAFGQHLDLRRQGPTLTYGTAAFRGLEVPLLQYLSVTRYE